MIGNLPPTTRVSLAAQAALGVLLGLGLLVRSAGLDQPIVENYVGRQIPTAMVARNLDRGSGFLDPRIDVAPLPNRFLVEPPVYAWLVVAMRRTTGLPLEACGRLVSALGIVLGGWGLFGLTVKREGVHVALGAVAVFLAFPVTIRYGRAFQPDALMLGTLVAGLRCWDDFETDGYPSRLAIGVALISVGLALKVISLYVLVPLVFVVARGRRRWKVALAAATLLPACLWYVHAADLIGERGGSRAAADNGGIWLRALAPDALARAKTYVNIARFLLFRAFTPLGPVLAFVALLRVGGSKDRLWVVWGGAALASMTALSSKLHHEYYWLALAPVVAVGVSRSLAVLCRHGVRGRLTAGLTACGFLVMSTILSASTWQTPPEWVSLRETAVAVRACVAESALVVAPEAVLFESDRRGCRLEFSDASALRAAGEWGELLEGSGPAALVEFYRRHGAEYFADVSPSRPTPERLSLHNSVRRRYKVLADRPGFLIAALNDPNERKRAEHAPGRHADRR